MESDSEIQKKREKKKKRKEEKEKEEAAPKDGWSLLQKDGKEPFGKPKQAKGISNPDLEVMAGCKLLNQLCNTKRFYANATNM